MTEQKLAQYSKLPEMEEQLKARMDALNQVGNQVGRVAGVSFRNIKIQSLYVFKLNIRSTKLIFDIKNLDNVALQLIGPKFS